MHSRPLRALVAIAACALVAGCAPVDVRRLAGDDTAGRNNNTAGSTTARQYLLDQIQPITDPVGGSYTHAIDQGTNVLGVIPGTDLPGQVRDRRRALRPPGQLVQLEGGRRHDLQRGDRQRRRRGRHARDRAGHRAQPSRAAR